MGYIMLLEGAGADHTLSTYAPEGGIFGFFTANDMAKRLNAKMYAEAKRLGVKWMLRRVRAHVAPGEPVHGHLERPGRLPEVPVPPVTGTRFENAKSTKMVHITEFTADLYHDKIKVDLSRNDHLVVTYRRLCNTARAMGLLEELQAASSTTRCATTTTRWRRRPSARKPVL